MKFYFFVSQCINKKYIMSQKHQMYSTYNQQAVSSNFEF